MVLSLTVIFALILIDKIYSLFIYTKKEFFPSFFTLYIALSACFISSLIEMSNEVLNWAYKKSKKVIFRILNLKLKN